MPPKPACWPRNWRSAGVRSSLDILEGEGGLGHAMSTGLDWSQVGATLGQDFHITRLTFKNHIGCGHTFPAIDGALELQRQHGFTHADIERLHVATYKPALDIACHVRAAQRRGGSVQPALRRRLRALVHGSVRLAAYEPAGSTTRPPGL